MKKILLFITLLVPSLLFAESTPTSDNDTFKVRMGGYLVARNDSVISGTTSRHIGAKINLQDDLGVDPQTNSFRIEARYRITDAHQLEFSYYNIRTKSSHELKRSFTFHEHVFSSGRNADSYLNIDLFKLNYAYSFYHTNKVELAWAAGLHMMGIKAGLSGAAGVRLDPNNGLPVNYDKDYEGEHVSFLAPLPVLGFRVNYAVTPRFHVNGAIDYFAIGVDNFKGNFIDLLMTAEYQLFDNWSTGVGINITSLDLEHKADKLNFEVQQDVTGFLFYVGYNF